MENSFETGLKIALQRFIEESERREALDTKAALILGFAGVLAGLLFNIMSDVLASVSASLAISAPLVLGCVVVLLSAFFSLGALWIRNYRGGPGSKILVHASKTNQEPELQQKLLEVYARASQHNWELNQRKAMFLYASFTAISIGILIVFTALVVFITM